MKTLFVLLVAIFLLKGVLSTFPGLNGGFVLDILAYQDPDKIEVDRSDSNAIIYTPKSGVEISKVTYGPEEVWSRGPLQRFQKLKVYLRENKHNHMDLFFTQAGMERVVVIAKHWGKWMSSKSFSAKLGEPLGPEANEMASKAYKPGEFQDEGLSLDLTSKPGSEIVMRRYVALGVPCTTYYTVVNKLLFRVYYSSETIWRANTMKGTMRQVFHFSKPGYNDLLTLSPMTDLFVKGSLYFEKYPTGWREISECQFAHKMKIVSSNDLDPFYNNYHPEFSSSSSESSGESSGEEAEEQAEDNVYDKLLPGQKNDSERNENVYETLDTEPTYVNLGPEGLENFDLYTDGTEPTREEPIKAREVPVVGGGLDTGTEPTRDYKSL